MNRRLKLICPILFLLSCYISAQESEITGIPFQFRTNPVTILGMVQDDKGYIWMCDTQYGLFRYDGTNLVHYPSQSTIQNSLISNRTECIATDGRHIWVGTFAEGLSRFDPETNTFTRYRHDPLDDTSVRSNAIRTLEFDQDGMLWIGTSSGIDRFDNSTGVFVHNHTDDPDEDILKTEHIRAMYVDRDGVLWIGSSSPFPNEATVGGLFKYEIDRGEVTHYLGSEDQNSLSNNMVRAIFEDGRGTFWVGTAGDGLHTMDRKNGTFERHEFDPHQPHKLSRPPIGDISSDHITLINEDNQGFIWIGTFAGGLSRYNPKSNVTHHYNTQSSDPYRISNNTFWSSLKTTDGLLWLGTWAATDYDDVLIKINSRPNKINHFEKPQLGNIFHILDGIEGEMLLGCQTGVWKAKKDNKIENVFPLELTFGLRSGARQVIPDDLGNLWVPTIVGLHKFNLESKVLEIYSNDPNDPESLPNNNVNAVEYLGNDQLLVGTQGGLSLMNVNMGTFEELPYSFDSVNVPINVSQIYKDHNDKIWIGTIYSGLKTVDPESGAFKDYQLASGFEDIPSIFEDSNGKIWIATQSNGLFLYNQKEDFFSIYQDEQGILTEQSLVQSIIEDHDKNIWLDIIGGFLKLNPETGNSMLFGQSWGVNTANTTGSSYCSSQGELIFGTNNGYYRFHPKDLVVKDINESIPFVSQFYADDIYISSFDDVVYQSQIEGLQSIGLDHDQNDISFEIGHIDYLTNSSDKRMQHWLEPYELEWQDANSGDKVSYYNVPPGNFTFHLRSANINGQWTENSLKIKISPPWWNTWWAYCLYGLFFAVGVWFVDRYQRQRVIREERARVQQKELAQAKEIEKAYSDLKATQTQLVQAEKMASLGELTAGIAHEIQNPLNFVNNFSEVSSELLIEMKGELEKGETQEAINIADDVIQNLEKITHHGNRADTIVKGMLQHSRTSSGEKVLTDLNALCDEYLRLSYHGLRAKDNAFNSDYKMDLYENLPQLKVVSQDIGRVILNLINNAFYAVHERRQKGSEDYQPMVKVSTINTSPDQEGLERIQITISDNGSGIPNDIKEKIFQPFFTTKPTGTGTGLGLSLAYDIVKAHGGELRVDSVEGKTEFIITLPKT